MYPNSPNITSCIIQCSFTQSVIASYPDDTKHPCSAGTPYREQHKQKQLVLIMLLMAWRLLEKAHYTNHKSINPPDFAIKIEMYLHHNIITIVYSYMMYVWCDLL